MDNRQLRTAMVTTSISKYMSYVFGEDGVERIANERFEGMQRVFNWRQSLNLNLSIAARGSTEGLWYVDFLQTPKSGWSDMMIMAQSPIELMMSVKAPKKILSFNADFAPAPFLQKRRFPETQICFINNQSLWNFEKFMRDYSTEIDNSNYYDVDYSVVDRPEIGQGDAKDFDLITMQSFEYGTDNQTLSKCVDALASGGVLLINSNNNSGKLYRDDYWFHPNNEMHKILKSSDGLMFHDSSGYGYTTFIKN
jgi:hypothetical protein